jgi:hypothetical protein
MLLFSATLLSVVEPLVDTARSGLASYADLRANFETTETRVFLPVASKHRPISDSPLLVNCLALKLLVRGGIKQFIIQI